MVKRGFLIKKEKNSVPSTYAMQDFNGEEIVGTFYEKELQKTNKIELRVEKKKGGKLMWGGNVIITCLIAG